MSSHCAQKLIMHLVGRARIDNRYEGVSRRSHYVVSLRKQDRGSLEALQVLVELGLTLHILAGDVIIGKSCPPLDARTQEVSLKKPSLKLSLMLKFYH